MSEKLPALKPKDVIRILEKLGFQLYRQRGSHRIFVKDEYQVIVPFHNRELKQGTLYNIIKGMGLTVEEFNRLRREKVP